MNERIKELAKEAGVAMFGDAVYMINSNDTLDVGVMEKFAMLIVKECENVSLQSSLRDDDMGAIIANRIRSRFDPKLVAHDINRFDGLAERISSQLRDYSDVHAGDGGYKISTQEKHEEFVKKRNGEE